MISCPIPKSEYENVLLAHGGGGKLTHQLIEKIFVSQFGNDLLNELNDSAVFEFHKNKLAFTTDSYVVQPIFFPGGNIGELAVNGTVNDIAVAGARPVYLSAGFIIEEGLPIDDLWNIVMSMKNAADKAGVKIVTGDTKVVEKGKADKLFINTSGVGVVYDNFNISSRNCKPGLSVILSGKIGDHGIAIMSARENLEFETEIVSDTAPLNGLVNALSKYSVNIKMLRDVTRGGLASVLNEIAASSGYGIEIEEEKIPINEQVRGACEILGLDPLYVANEGKLVAFVDDEKSEEILSVMKSLEVSKDAEIIGKVVDEHPQRVVMRTSIGSKRIVDMISGEQLPRIC